MLRNLSNHYFLLLLIIYLIHYDEALQLYFTFLDVNNLKYETDNQLVQ